MNTSWKPNPLITCNCGRDLRVSCRKTQVGCWSIEGKAYRNRQKWLKNSLTMCTCVNKQIACTNLSRPACTDVNGVVRQYGNHWFPGACFNCTCIDGVVSCVKFHVAISYGLFKAMAVGTCIPCYRAWEDIRPADNGTVSNCEGKYKIESNRVNLVYCCFVFPDILLEQMRYCHASGSRNNDSVLLIQFQKNERRHFTEANQMTKEHGWYKYFVSSFSILLL